MRVVFDTTILARGADDGSAAAKAILAVIDGPHVMLTSEFMLDELSRVLRYERLRSLHGLSDPGIDTYIRFIRAASVSIPFPSAGIDAVVLSDPNDDPIVATALYGGADIICTWDKDFLDAQVQEYLSRSGIRVLRDSPLLQELQSKDKRAA